MVNRSYLVDESGSVVELIIPSGANAGTYLVTYNGHGDAQALRRIKLLKRKSIICTACRQPHVGVPC